MYLQFFIAESAHCFCKLEGRIDDCECNVESVDHFNNQVHI